MNKKKAAIVIAVILLIIALIALWIFWRRGKEPATDISGSECLLFQSNDASAPCYAPSGGLIPSDTPATSTEGGIPVPDQATTSAAFPSACAQEATTIDRNGCVSDLAAQSHQPGICDFVVGSLAQASCMNGLISKPVEVSKAPNAYQDFMESFIKASAATGSSIVKSAGFTTGPSERPVDPRYTIEGFKERFISGSRLSIYALSQYQAKPGETVTMYGAGFADPNTLIVGSAATTDVSSADGMSLSFTAPLSTGEYEISVSNSKGVAKLGPKLIVTTDPAPRPQITGVSPSSIDLSTEVTLTGIGFTDNNAVSTTLGLIPNVSSSGSSIRFKVADLPVVAQVKDNAQVKGKKISVGVYVSNQNGFNQKLFYFDVQF